MKKLAIEYWTPLFLWLVAIFLFSTDRFSAGETSRIIVPLLRFFFPSLSAHDLDFFHGVVRKLGHVTEYSILALLAYRSFKQHASDPVTAKLRTLAFVAVAAMSDELHQAFTLFRTASPMDVGYDCLGAVCALWLLTLYEIRRLRSYSVL